MAVGLDLVLVAAGILAYANSFCVPFIFDDYVGILENRHLCRLWPFWEAMSAPPQSPVAGRPVVSLSLAINYAIDGLNVRGYHALNLAAHLLSAVLLTRVVRRTLLSPVLGGRFTGSAGLLAFASAVIWLLHPLLTEAVTYLVQRTELFMALFYLATLYAAMRYAAEEPKWRWLVAAVVFCALGMASKECMVSAPLVVFLYDRTFVSGSFREAWCRHRALHAGLVMTWVILVAIVWSGPRNDTVGFSHGVGAPDYLRTQVGVLTLYLRLCVWPHPLMISYADWPVATDVTAVLPQALLVLTLAGATVWALWRRPALGFLGAWFFLILAPTSSFVPIVTEFAAERRMYLPLAAITVLVVVCAYGVVAGLAGRRGMRSRVPLWVGGGLVLTLAVLLGSLTATRNRDYRDELTIWSDAVRKRPANALAHTNLGVVLEQMGRIEEAMDHHSEAIRLKPADANAYINRGMIYGRRGEYALAVADLTKAIELNPHLPEAYGNRGNVHGLMGEYDLAIADYDKALEIEPYLVEAYNGRGLVLAQTGDLERSMADYNRAIDLKPDYVDAHMNRGTIYVRKGDFDRAITDFSRLLEVSPGDIIARNARGIAYLQKGELHLAVKDFDGVIELAPGNPQAYNNRGAAYCAQKEYDKAWADIKTCRMLGGVPHPTLVRELSEAIRRSE